MKADEVAVWVSYEELGHASILIPDRVPPCLWLHQQRVCRLTQARQERLDVGDGDLEVDATAIGWFEWPGKPVSTNSVLLKHDVRGPTREVGEPVLDALVADGETAESSPLQKARLTVRSRTRSPGTSAGSCSKVTGP